MKRRILWRRGSAKMCTPATMALALKEEWESITIGEINQEIVKLPKIMDNCIRQSGGNKFQAYSVFFLVYLLYFRFSLAFKYCYLCLVLLVSSPSVSLQPSKYFYRIK